MPELATVKIPSVPAN